MNKNILSGMIFGAALLLFAACTQDELTNGADTLPEGMYPLDISSVTLGAEVSSQPWGANVPQTRVSENTERNSSKWDGGEVITVQLGDNKAPTTTYEVKNTDGTLELTGNQLYWAKREDKVTAWYPENGTIPLSNQSGGLAYVLQATAEKAAYDKPVALDFSHQLAKIRVKLAGEKAGSVNDVKIESYTSCTNTNGTVSTDGATVGEITMYHLNGTNIYEANVVSGKAIEKFKVNNGDWVVLSPPVTPVYGKYHEININVKQATLKPIDGKFTVNGGNVLIKDHTGNEPIVVNGNATITLDNVKLTTTGTTMEINNGAAVTLNVRGTDNVFTSIGGAGIKIMDTTNSGQRGSITINGTNASSSKLKVMAASGAAVGFRMAGDADWVTKYCGNIEINNITLEATGGNGSPAIGISAIETDAWDIQKTYGKISINGSTVNASSTGGAACIGTPSHGSSSPFTLEGISISNSTITAIAEGNQAACIGFGYTNYSNEKIIKKIEFTNTTLRLTTGASNKVGFGGGDNQQLTEGIWNNGSKVGDTGWNP